MAQTTFEKLHDGRAAVIAVVGLFVCSVSPSVAVLYSKAQVIGHSGEIMRSQDHCVKKKKMH